LLDPGIEETGADGLNGESTLALVVFGTTTGHKGTESILLIRTDISAIQLVVHGCHRGSNVGGVTGSNQNGQAGKDCNVK